METLAVSADLQICKWGPDADLPSSALGNSEQNLLLPLSLCFSLDSTVIWGHNASDCELWTVGAFL